MSLPFFGERILLRRILIIIALVIAGEMVFGLPFHTGRFFRPTMLDVFGFTNTQLGDLFAVYGVTAMLTYFPGGALADHFSARKLIALSLLTTGAGGLFMASIPSNERSWAAAPGDRPNVLFLAVDDLNDWVGCLGGHPQAKTPNIDKLARKGILFQQAHCAAPLCSPSRTSIMTGLRPSTTGIYGNLNWFRDMPLSSQAVKP